MTLPPQPQSSEKSLAIVVLSELVNLSGRIGELRAETRHHSQRLTALERRMDSTPPRQVSSPPAPPASSRQWPMDLARCVKVARTVWGLAKLVPWGVVAILGAAIWNWLAPLLRVLPWM